MCYRISEQHSFYFIFIRKSQLLLSLQIVDPISPSQRNAKPLMCYKCSQGSAHMEISGQLLNDMQSKSVVMRRNARGREDSLVGNNSSFTKK